MNDTSDTSVLKVKTNDCSFDNNNVRSREYDDIFFQKDGIDESKYVFFDQNNIQEKFDKLKPNSSFTIGEIGFGLGFILSKEQIGTYWFGSVSAISIISWTIFFLIIQVKAFFSLSGLKISYYSLIGFISIILGYIAMYSLELPSHTFISMGS